MHVLADNIPDLLNNFEDVLKIARMCGLTFKPNKIVVALIHSTLFVWNLSGSEWSPTDHTVSALSVAKLPNTVKVFWEVSNNLRSVFQVMLCCYTHLSLWLWEEPLLTGYSGLTMTQKPLKQQKMQQKTFLEFTFPTQPTKF